MPDTKLRSQKATQQLKEDHKKVKELFSEYEDLGDKARAGRMQLFSEIKKELTLHAQIEEEIFYPGLRQVKDEECQDLLDEAAEEHKIVKTLIEEISAIVPEDDAFDAKVKVLQENVEHHAEEEEKEMFPFFDELEREEQNDISERLRIRKQELTEEYPE